jgi:hypothetical protein
LLSPRGGIASNITNIRKRGKGDRCPAGARRKRRHRGDIVEGEEERCNTRSTFKNSNATLATYV